MRVKRRQVQTMQCLEIGKQSLLAMLAGARRSWIKALVRPAGASSRAFPRDLKAARAPFFTLIH
jgi:hypothetical protein